jgi:hypothetical protein
MSDIIEGVVVDVVDGEMIELEVEHVHGHSLGSYGARVLVRVTEGGHGFHSEALNDEEAAHMMMDFANRRVRCSVIAKDDEGRLIGDLEVLGFAKHDDTDSPDDSGE